jgi:hypothetical protein
MPKDPTPLSESEEFQLRSLLDKRSQSLPEAQAVRDRERDQERKLREKSDRLAAEEQKLSRRLAELRVDLDCVSAEIYKLAASGVAFRHVSERLMQLGDLIPQQSYFNSSRDSMNREAIQLLAEIGLALYLDGVRPKGGKPLRERMREEGSVEVGPSGPGGNGTDDPRTTLAAAIINAGRRARGETS